MSQVEGPPVSSWSFAIGLRTAVHDLLMQHGFHSEWRGDIRISSVSSAAGATAKIAAVVQTGGGFSVMAEEAPLRKTAKIAMDGQLLPCRELSKSHTSSPHWTWRACRKWRKRWLTILDVSFYGTGALQISSRRSSHKMPPQCLNGPPAVAMLAGTDSDKKYRRYRLDVVELDRLRLSARAQTYFPKTRPAHCMWSMEPCALHRVIALKDREFFRECGHQKGSQRSNDKPSVPLGPAAGFS